ncbi:hypothetical protein ZWY2020_049057 [Hordeum vulgare]|nr:hypothetical protein ZWY2020_049057 [Hordeum vulgare]
MERFRGDDEHGTTVSVEAPPPCGGGAPVAAPENSDLVRPRWAWTGRWFWAAATGERGGACQPRLRGTVVVQVTGQVATGWILTVQPLFWWWDTVAGASHPADSVLAHLSSAAWSSRLLAVFHGRWGRRHGRGEIPT